jgi:hypothetical protein
MATYKIFLKNGLKLDLVTDRIVWLKKDLSFITSNAKNVHTGILFAQKKKK